MSRKINKILIANRGEIALRIIRSAKEMGITTVAVYSDADRDAPHVIAADEAVLLGPPPSSESYLLGEKIIEESIRLQVDAIHPGYGFLSENGEFASKVEKAGLIFIGPSAKSIDMMGDKLKAKEAVSGYDIPMVPGADKAITDIPAAAKLAEEIGYPILIKASAGGGGKGMRIVNQSADFESEMDQAQGEARSAFGNDAVFIEKYVGSPRHIEIQILGDQHGNIVHLFERDCSIQRRHQKVVEEAPSSILTNEMRAKMGASAVDVARACGYYGAGTVEFLMDENLNYYFLEMNTRLQVEHPVTEYITGLDLVKEMILIAQGEKLSFSQDDLTINGHAMELRVYAEDAANGFLPDTGTLSIYERPQGPGVRVDDGLREGMEIPIYYDPMIAKLVTHGATREEAMDRMIRAIDEYHISGVVTTLPFGKYVMKHDAFRSGNFNTHFVRDHFVASDMYEKDPDELIAAAILAVFVKEEASTPIRTNNDSTQQSNWKNNRSHND